MQNIENRNRPVTERRGRTPGQPVRRMPQDPPEGVHAVVYAQLGALIANSVIQLCVLWAAIDAFARHEYGLVGWLALVNGVLLGISLAVIWFGRVKEDK